MSLLSPARPRLLRRGASRLATRLLIALAVTGVITAASVNGSVAIIERQWETLPTVSIPAGVLQTEPEQRHDPVSFLLVGTDSRAFVESEADQESFGTTSDTPGLADAIMLIRVVPEEETAFVLSIPRDTWVTLPDGSEGRINAAYTEAQGGVTGLLTTISDTFGVQVNHTLEIDFEGVRTLVDELGGIDIEFPYPMRDRFTGLDVGEAGVIHLTGSEALAYVRSCHAQFLIDGSYQNDPQSDLARAQRQQYFLRELARTAVDQGFDDFNKVNSLLGVLEDHLTISQDLDVRDAVSILQVMRAVDPTDVDSIQTATLPTEQMFVGAADVQRWLADSPDTIVYLATLNGERDTADAIDVSDTPVDVVDGTGTTGLSDSVATELVEDGFGTPRLLEPDDVATLVPLDPATPPPTTEARYAPHRQLEAERVIQSLGGFGTPVRDDNLPAELPGVEVLVVLGADAPGEFPVAATTTPASGAAAPG